jgi:adenosylcobinamide-GDP ribazoletransferase
MRTPRMVRDLGAALQFLTRIPLPRLTYDPEALSRSAMFFPLVGLAIGAVAAILYIWLLNHLPALVAALFTVLFTVVITGALHEDGLADAADGFGGGSSREQVLAILKDSRIGAYGALAVVFAITGRIFLIGALPRTRAVGYLLAAHVLARWTILPLGHFLPAARSEASQGARLARQISAGSVFIGTAVTVAVVGCVLRTAALVPILMAVVITALTGVYYRRRVGGITGDCFGATLQITEIAVYCAGVWRR